MDKIEPISVLHIASGDLWAGAEVQLFTLVKTLKLQQNIRVDVILLNHGTLEQKLLDNDISVTVLDESKLNGFQILLRLINTTRKINPDVIHSHRIKENILGSVAALLTNTPSLRTAHGAPEHRPAWFHIPKRLIIFLDWFSGRFIQNKIIAVSKDLADILKNTFPEKKITIVENGTDIDYLTQLTQNRVTQPQREPPLTRVGIAGRLVPIKRIDLFIKAAQHLMQTQDHMNISFHVYGEGPLLDSLQQLSKTLHTENIVHFEGHCNDIHSRLQELDVLLMTSDHEGLPMILLEAMALKVPVIAHAVGGIPDLMDNGGCGILINEHDAKTYADSLYDLLNNPEKKTLITENALQRIKKHYSAESNASNYCLQYNLLIK